MALVPWLIALKSLFGNSGFWNELEAVEELAASLQES